MHTYVPRVRAQGGEGVGDERAGGRRPHTSLASTAKEGGAAAKGGSGKGRARPALGARGRACHEGHHIEGGGKHRQAGTQVKHCLFGCCVICLLLLCEGWCGAVREGRGGGCRSTHEGVFFNTFRLSGTNRQGRKENKLTTSKNKTKQTLDKDSTSRRFCYLTFPRFAKITPL